MIQNPNEIESTILPVMNEDNGPAELSIASGVDNQVIQDASGEHHEHGEGTVVADLCIVNHFPDVIELF